MKVICSYCGADAELVGGDVIYPRRPDLASRRFWRCAPCDAWVGTHIHSRDAVPLGRLANAELRIAKREAHAVFDPLWQAKSRRDGCSKKQARTAAYKWLSEQLGISRRQTHIGMFDIELCRRVIEVCTPHLQRRTA
jgi:hypothetical protein